MLLSVFPEILFLAPFSALFVRIALGLVFGYAASRHFQSTESKLRAFAIAEGALMIALIVGAWTQPAAIVGIVIIGAWFMYPSLRTVALGTALLSIVLALTLLITGAGPFAFDLPL